MSKSKGTGILAKDFEKMSNPELLRYYFAAKLNDKVEDIDLNFEDYVQRINSDLVGKYLNIASRSASFIKRNNNQISENIDIEFIKTLTDEKTNIITLYENRQYSKLIRLVMEWSTDLTAYETPL